MWDLLSRPFNEPLVLSDRSKKENSFQIAGKEKNLLNCYIQGKSPSASVLCVCGCVCGCVSVGVSMCMSLHLSRPIVWQD